MQVQLARSSKKNLLLKLVDRLNSFFKWYFNNLEPILSPKFSQKAFKKDHKLKPSKLEEEPSISELLCHLDFGNLVVKAPKLNKGSSMNISSPLGTAGIREQCFS